MRPRPKRASRRRAVGRELLRHLPTHEIDVTGKDIVPVTFARNFVRTNSIEAPAVILVKRTEFTTDRFYWSPKGMYSALYAEHNYVQFSCLSKLYDHLIATDKISPDIGLSLITLDCDVEEYRPEYAYI